MSMTNASPMNQSQPASISVVDLQNLLAIIDLATQRGAFRGGELSQVGQLFDRLTQFLQSVMPQDTAQAAQQAAPQQQAPQTQMPQAPSPVMPMSPPFSPKVGA
jgi:hypothetical protein